MTPFTFSTVSAALFACAALGAGASAAAPAVPGGLYAGYYQEDPRTNPEDPTPGAFVLTLPDGDAAFNGAMFFTYVGCQNNNVGKVKGAKKGVDLSGTWAGAIDGSAQSGPYSGKYDASAGHYKGVYAVAGGKQTRNVEGCIQYVIGANGSWEMFPVEQNQPAGFKLSLAARRLSWDQLPQAALTLVYVIDPALARTGGANPVKFQTVLPGPGASYSMAAAELEGGKEYVAAVLVSNDKAQRIAFGTRRFTAP